MGGQIEKENYIVLIEIFDTFNEVLPFDLVNCREIE
jgi:hypothetical protein